MRAVERACAMLRRLAGERFYGKITVEYKAGTIILVRQERTIMRDDLPTNGKTDGNPKP